MREVVTMWKYTKMVVLTALTAGVFAAILIPMKGIPIIPGSTELRPAAVIPVVFGILFGPAGAWGSAFGNLIGDFFGTLGIGSIFGFVGNFFFSLVAYKVYNPSKNNFKSNSRGKKIKPKEFIKFASIGFLSSCVCAEVIAWGLELVGLLPFSWLGSIIFVNNFIMNALIGPFILMLLYPRVKRWDLLWTDIMGKNDLPASPSPRFGQFLIWIGGIGGLVSGLSISTGIYGASLLATTAGTVGNMVTLAVAPFLLMLLIGCFLA